MAAFVATALVVPPSARAGSIATGASLTQTQDGTRFVLELSGDLQYRTFVVDGPPRLVVDLDDVVFDIDGPAAGEGIVTAWRFGALSPTAGRIVFDLDRPALVVRSDITPGSPGQPARLILDLKPTDAARFAHAAQSATANAADLPDPPATDPDSPVVVIDPGHGGIDPGATGRDGSLEKDVVLAFAERLAERLAAVPGLTVRLTRTDDSFLSLNRRIRIARAYRADLFISIHADAAPQDYVQGATVYTLSELPSDAQAAAIAARENLADAVSGAIEPNVAEDVSGILADLLRRETKVFSYEFADRLLGALSPTVRMNANPHRYARFRVLMAHDIPSVLFELGYLTNDADSRVITTTRWQDEASAAVTAAVLTFFGLDEPDETTSQAMRTSGATTR